MYPLFSTQRHFVTGPDFVAHVVALCRILMVQEGDSDWWVYGVEPGGIAEDGDTPALAYVRFGEAFKAVLHEIADDSKDFEEFAKNVRKFGREVNEPTAKTWSEAVEAVRKGREVSDQFSSLPKMDAAIRCFVDVNLVGQQPLSEMTYKRSEANEELAQAACQ